MSGLALRAGLGSSDIAGCLESARKNKMPPGKANVSLRVAGTPQVSARRPKARFITQFGPRPRLSPRGGFQLLPPDSPFLPAPLPRASPAPAQRELCLARVYSDLLVGMSRGRASAKHERIKKERRKGTNGGNARAQTDSPAYLTEKKATSSC